MSVATQSKPKGALNTVNTLRVYNTLSKTKEPLETVRPGNVGIYLCGPTVYKEAHIGHMVGPVIFDAIKRYLTYCGYDVTWVVNITDIDDKIIEQSRQRNLPMAQIAEEMTQDYLKNLASFGVDQIDHMPRATETMGEIVAFIQDLIDKGFAYESAGDVFFDVTRDSDYGKLSNRSADSQQGEGGGAAAKKRSPGDFALWKSAKAGEPSWESPWGAGRPGWHIECSAMSRNLLGETFDIHGGGLDLVFPHHENEIAQSECRHGKPMAKYWMHNGLMRASTAAGKVGGRGDRDGEEQATTDTKISRSKGAGGLASLVERQGGERLRFFLLRTHYRSTIVFSEEAVAEAGAGLDTFYRFFERYERLTGERFYDLQPIARRSEGEIDAGDDPLLGQVNEHRDSFLSKMDDDFNTGAAMSDLFELVRTLNKHAQTIEDAGSPNADQLVTFTRGVLTLRELSAIFGLFRQPPATSAKAESELAGKLLDLLVELRTFARSKKDFAMADKIRDGLTSLGVTLEDRKDGTQWRIE
ncbi:MAG: cysteine--tRNA ligase [Planctomycetes bacterium]|nr:cysteine--tRNA ligase [Planctomycetota bacterium]